MTLHRGMLFEWRIYEGGFPLAQRGRRMAEHLLEGRFQAGDTIRIDVKDGSFTFEKA